MELYPRPINRRAGGEGGDTALLTLAVYFFQRRSEKKLSLNYCEHTDYRILFLKKTPVSQLYWSEPLKEPLLFPQALQSPRVYVWQDSVGKQWFVAIVRYLQHGMCNQVSSEYWLLRRTLTLQKQATTKHNSKAVLFLNINTQVWMWKRQQRKRRKENPHKSRSKKLGPKTYWTVTSLLFFQKTKETRTLLIKGWKDANTYCKRCCVPDQELRVYRVIGTYAARLYWSPSYQQYLLSSKGLPNLCKM